MDSTSNQIVVVIGFTKQNADKPSKHRTCSEVCIDIDNIHCIKDSKRIYEELVINRKKYCLVELEFMFEYLTEKVMESIEIKQEIKQLWTRHHK